MGKWCKYERRYSTDWEKESDFKDWIQKVATDSTELSCVFALIRLPFVIHAIIFGLFLILFVATFWLVLVNSLAIKFSCTWQPWISLQKIVNPPLLHIATKFHFEKKTNNGQGTFNSVYFVISVSTGFNMIILNPVLTEGVRTLRTQDTSAPNTWCRSVSNFCSAKMSRTLRH